SGSRRQADGPPGVLMDVHAGRAADVYVHENPWRAIGLAAGAGLVIGLLISRR
ncbi:MAG: DUF883 family protein, partial [Comamonadaceae bacterium]